METRFVTDKPIIQPTLCKVRLEQTKDGVTLVAESQNGSEWNICELLNTGYLLLCSGIKPDAGFQVLGARRRIVTTE